MKEDVKLYNRFLSDIKNRVRQGQVRAGLSANAEMLAAYWDIGKMIHERQKLEGWGKAVIPRLAKDLKNELAEVKGFSERNINYMMIFYREYHDLSFLQLPVAKLESNENSTQSEVELAGESNAKLALSQSTDINTSIGQRSVAQLPDGKNSDWLLNGFRRN
jgi:hypothetical protein